MFCRKCGAEIRPNAKFCGKCGAQAPIQTETPGRDTGSRNTAAWNTASKSTASGNTASKSTTSGNTASGNTASWNTSRPDDSGQSAATKTRTKKNNTMSLEELLALATRYGDAEDYRQQLHILQHAQKQYPDVAGIYNLMGIAHRNLGDYYQAVECYRRASELEPDNGVFLTNTGIVLLSSNHADESLAFFEKGLPLLKKADSPAYPSALGNYALALAKSGYSDNAVRCIKEAALLGYANAGEVRRQMEALGIFYH